MLLLNERSEIRPWISFEAGWAWGTGKKIIPVCFDGLTKGTMPRPYSELQGLDLRTDYTDLLKDCYHYLDNLGSFASPVLPAPNDPRVLQLKTALDDAEGPRPAGPIRAPSS